MRALVKQMFTKSPFVYITFGSMLGYTLLNMLLNEGFVYLPFLKTFNLSIVISFMIGNVVIAVLVGLNLSLLTYHIKEARILQKGGITLAGIFTGLMGGFCPGCFIGLFPLVLSIFGVTASVGTLPFLGLELILASIIILGISAILLSKEQKVCKL